MCHLEDPGRLLIFGKKCILVDLIWYRSAINFSSILQPGRLLGNDHFLQAFVALGADYFTFGGNYFPSAANLYPLMNQGKKSHG